MPNIWEDMTDRQHDASGSRRYAVTVDDFGKTFRTFDLLIWVIQGIT